MSDVTPSHSESEVDEGFLNLRSRKVFSKSDKAEYYREVRRVIMNDMDVLGTLGPIYYTSFQRTYEKQNGRYWLGI